MSRVPSTHHARAHDQLLDAMAEHARGLFVAAERRWDPTRLPEAADDPGRGLLDCYATALHVLWTYQQAWADECFLPTATLPASVAGLLELVGHAPRPPLSATGLQHFVLKAGAAVTLPAGLQVRAPARDGRPEAVFETARALRANADLNELRPLLTVPPPVVDVPAVGVGVAPPPDRGLDGQASVAEMLASRVDSAQRGAAQARDAARARSQALQLADLATQLSDAGAGDACPDTFQSLCEQLCEQAHAVVDTAALERPVEPLSEAQELVLGELARIEATLPAALGHLDQALARTPGEQDAAYGARLDALAGFLDALVEGILQRARDDVARLRGPRALTALDRALVGGAGPGQMGTAEPGTDRLYLLPTLVDLTQAPRTQAALLRPGDWLLLAETVDAPTSDGGRVPQRQVREALRVVAVADEIAPALGEPATRVVFTPPLVGRYDLSRTVLLGNVVEVSHGRTVVRTQRGPGPWPVTDEPLAWLPDPSAPDGRVPAVHLEVGGQPWAPTTDLTSARPQARVFEVDRDAAGHSTVVVGDDNEGAAVPAVADVRLATRVGTGQDGNRPAGAVDEIGAPAPLVAATSNPLPTGGGADAEDPAAARASAVAGVQALDRAVTTDDLQALVLSYGLVRRARVVHDPVRRRRHLTVVVSGDGGRVLTPDEHRTLRAFLAARVPPGVALHTVDRVVVGIRAAIRLEVVPGADALQVVADAYRGLGATAHATNGSPPVEAPGLLDPDAVDLGQTIHRSDLHRALATVPGLARVAVDALHRADAPPGRADRLAFAPAELPRWDDDTGGVPALAVRWEVWVDR